MIESAEQAEDKHGEENAVDDIVLDVVDAFALDFFFGAEDVVFGDGCEFVLDGVTFAGDGVIAAARDEEPGEAIVDVHVVVGVDAEDAEDIVDEFVPLGDHADAALGCLYSIWSCSCSCLMSNCVFLLKMMTTRLTIANA